MQRLLLLNGPNLNLLGTRRPDVYGSTTLQELEQLCAGWASELGLELETFHSNHEGTLIDRIHAARRDADGIVFNPGALTHTSYALHDAVEAVGIPTVEVHISNVQEREEWRRTSVIRPACVHTIYGRGIDGYRWAIRHLYHRAEWTPSVESYGAVPDQVADVRVPDIAGTPAVAVLVHGGFWRHMWTKDTMDGIAVDLARRNIASINVEYRRVGAGGGWPGSADDVTAAVHWALERDDVDPERCIVIGHSAGGHLAAIAADRLAASGHRVALLSMAGVLDMEAALHEELGAGAAHAFLAGADPTSASPLHTFDVPFDTIIAHGTDDDRVPVSQARRFAAMHPHAHFYEFGETGHFEFLERSHPVWREVAGLVEEQLA